MLTLQQMPDRGAEITVHTRSGRAIKGFVHPGHTWAGDNSLCLTDNPDHGLEGNAIYHYVLLADIESWVWDCRA